MMFDLKEKSEKIYIAGNFPDEFTGSESRLSLRGAVTKAKANASLGIPELIQIATNRQYSEKKETSSPLEYILYGENPSLL